MKKKILIVGSTGYLGSVLYLYLSSKNYECIAHDVDYFKNTLLYKCQKFKKLKDNYKDVCYSDLRGFYAVIFLAGFSNDPFGDLNPSQFYKPTVKYTVKIAKLCKKLGVKFIFPSSCSVYGTGSNSLLNEESKVNPLTPLPVV